MFFFYKIVITHVIHTVRVSFGFANRPYTPPNALLLLLSRLKLLSSSSSAARQERWLLGIGKLEKPRLRFSEEFINPRSCGRHTSAGGIVLKYVIFVNEKEE